MNNTLDKNAQLEVEISNLRATSEELEQLKSCITNGMGNNGTPPVSLLDGEDSKCSRYIVTFRVLNPRNFNTSTVQAWLYAAKLVGWSLEATFVKAK